MPSRAAVAAVVAGVWLLDRLTKWIIETRVSSWDNYVVIPGFFSIVHTQNSGAAFGLFSDSASEWRATFLIGLSLAVMALVAVMLIQTFRASAMASMVLRYGLALVLGGALGNLFDRVRVGTVTDFLLFYVGPYQWPVFNVADTSISVGAGLILLDMWKNRHAARAA
jgi:signal peptidase II